MQKSICSIFTLLILWTSASTLSAQKVTVDAAKEKATQFFSKPQKANAARKTPRKAPQLVLANDRDEFYVFNDEANGGYVVVCGDKRMPDVLGYSYSGNFDAENIPCNMKALLEGYAEQVNRLRTDGKANIKASHRANSEWSPISPMLECTWGHWTPYNNLCPEIDGKHTASGCVAIAMAQIMCYHEWPKQTTDIIPGYTTETLGLVIPDTPVTTIDWDNMMNYYNPYDENKYERYTKEQADAVATLMKLCNVAVKMDFNQSESSAYMSDVPGAFLKYFDYDSTIEDLYKDNGEYDIEEWNQIVYDELSNGRPVMCAEPGHAFVIDGYDKDNYFHMNFGEHDKVTCEDGYFLLTWVYSIITGIQPNDPDAPHVYAIFDEGKLSFYYDKEKGNRSGEIFTNLRSCASGNADIEECEFDPSFANVKLRNLEGFFENYKNLKTIKGINYLNTSEVRTMKKMFNGCSSLESLNLSSFNTEKVTNMYEMFHDCSSLVSLDISNFNTEKVTNMMNMFVRCSALTSLDVSSFNTKNVKDMNGLFYGLESLTTLDVSNFNTTKVTDMRVMFHGCSSLKELDLSNFDTSNVKDMGWMFGNCNNLMSLHISGFKTDKVKDMAGMFHSCSNLTSLDVSGFNTDKVTTMYGMFAGCSGLKNLDMGSFNTDNVTNMERMFGWCSGLTSLDVSNFKTDNVTDMSMMFYGCYNISTIYVSENWKMLNVVNSDNMFYACDYIVGGAGTAYDYSHSNGDYARLDGGPENPGYFTYKEKTNAIQTVKANEDNSNIYSLSGVRLRSGTKDTDGLKSGIYIVKGKKLMVK